MTLTVKEFISTYEKRHIKHLEYSTQKAQWQIINKTILPLFGEMLLTDISRSHAQELHDYVTGVLDNSNRTSNEHLGVLSTILKCALEAEKINALPPLKRLPNGTQEDHKYLTQEQVALLLEATPKGTLRDMVYVDVNTGLRIGEIRMLQWVDFAPDFATARICRSLSGRSDKIEEITTMKGKEIRTIFFDEALQKVIKRQPKVSPYVFTDDKDLTHRLPFVSYKFCHDLGIMKAMKAAGVWKREFGFHTLRHTYACLAARDGANVYELQRFMGHKHITTTMRYIEMFDRDLKDTASKLSGRFKIE